jgi:hypothetical protein
MGYKAGYNGNGKKASSMQLVVSNMVHAHPQNNDAKLCV